MYQMPGLKRFLLVIFAFFIGGFFVADSNLAAQESGDQKTSASRKQPNFVFAIADDWGWPHASAYGDRALKTPTFDSIAKNGVLFKHAFVSSPSCTPSRGAIITGKHFWELGQAANLWSEWPDARFPEFPKLLNQAGYFTGHYRKAWGPGKFSTQPAGTRYKSVDAFFEQRVKDQPFCFWFGASDPHRGYKYGSGKASGIELEDVHLFEHFPDTEVVRNDIADYYFEVQRFDRELGDLLVRLESMGELDNTWVIVTGDHGMPFPRCKSHLYDSGTRVPLAIRGPGITPGRTIDDFVSLIDIAPTIIEASGNKIPNSITGRSMLSILESSKSGTVDDSRSSVIFGRERHTVSQEKGIRGGYPMRAIRNRDYLFILNYYPDRWPSGTPDFENAEFRKAWLSDCDNGPTKTEIWDQRKTSEGKRIYQLSFGKRPAEELYDLATDPGQLNNLASDPNFLEIRNRLRGELQKALINANDPRASNPQINLDQSGKYRGGGGGQWKPNKK